jgi:alanyl-tRNA synthetase
MDPTSLTRTGITVEELQFYRNFAILILRVKWIEVDQREASENGAMRLVQDLLPKDVRVLVAKNYRQWCNDKMV